jgi:uncharacterized membrane protein
LIALIGFADASYLTIEHYKNVIPPCTTSGCATVLTSAYSAVLGVPVSLLGAIYYLALLIGTFVYLEAALVGKDLREHHHSILKWIFIATVLGMAASLWFLYVQAFVIHSYCQYCLGSAGSSTALFVIAVVILKKHHEKL